MAMHVRGVCAHVFGNRSCLSFQVFNVMSWSRVTLPPQLPKYLNYRVKSHSTVTTENSGYFRHIGKLRIERNLEEKCLFKIKLLVLIRKCGVRLGDFS